ncbi:hypothetical protein BT67DRAFT_56359 [Trichocladium antarcticum]|uniref:Uncharacterized protein n=1 Tax=Trichocladium antarcticum TaxID=1450529 RepID=A0AAN6ZCQ7_9PEZI|nr:hypothetical protein BT67DRAFT_56359 [Trichocladium antarcticum]
MRGRRKAKGGRNLGMMAKTSPRTPDRLRSCAVAHSVRTRMSAASLNPELHRVRAGRRTMVYPQTRPARADVIAHGRGEIQTRPCCWEPSHTNAGWEVRSCRREVCHAMLADSDHDCNQPDAACSCVVVGQDSTAPHLTHTHTRPSLCKQTELVQVYGV